VVYSKRSLTSMRSGFLSLLPLVTILACPAWAASPAAPSDPQVEQVFSKIPLRFEALAEDRWVARGLGFSIGFTGNSALLGMRGHGLEISFKGASTGGRLKGENKSKNPNNYFTRGSFRSADVFLKLRRADLYPGVDLVYYGQGRGLEYDFELAPGADVSPVRMRFNGAAAVRLASDGSLILTFGETEVIQKAPVTYQRKADGEVVAVASSYYPEDDGSFSIRLGDYDTSAALVIDPQVLFTTYLSGSGAEEPISISRDGNGTIYVAGKTFSDDFPLAGTPYSVFNLTPNEHIFTTKINPFATGDNVIPYSGFFGGDFGDMLKAAVVDANGVLYMTGLTDDFFFPVTSGAFRNNNGSVRRCFLSALDTKIPGTAGLIYSTFFCGAGADAPTAIALANGKVYITGTTSAPGGTTTDDFPLKDPIQDKRAGGVDGWVSEFDITQSGAASLVKSTYLGGTSLDVPLSIAVDSVGKVYVAGYTGSGDFPTTSGAVQGSYRGQQDAFLTKLNLDAGVIEYSTYFGTPQIDQAWKVMLDPTGRVAIGGFTLSSSFPVTANGMQRVAGGGGDAFLTILDLNTSAVVYSTYFGGSGGEVINDMRVGPSGAYYFAGYTLSRDLPIRDAYSSVSARQSTDGFVAIVDPSAAPADALLLSTYFTGGGAQQVKGIEVDPAGVVYITGYTLGNVFQPGQATPLLPESNVFFIALRPSSPALIRRESTTLPATAPQRRPSSRQR